MTIDRRFEGQQVDHRAANDAVGIPHWCMASQKQFFLSVREVYASAVAFSSCYLTTTAVQNGAAQDNWKWCSMRPKNVPFHTERLSSAELGLMSMMRVDRYFLYSVSTENLTTDKYWRESAGLAISCLGKELMSSAT